MRNKPELTSNSGKFNLRYIFGMKLRSFRQEKGFGLKQLAALTGLSAYILMKQKRGKSIQKQKK